ncbi:hypothetical protein [Nevskia ramosa]|uniref:hypothetical protein n=1 Tax=Nevskia ramosa TaxID=64002 RepID=UPI003D09CE64
MRASTPLAPPLLPVVDGSTTFPQASAGGRCWSSVYGVPMEWTGSRWRVADVPGSLNSIPAGETRVIPVTHNLLVFGGIVLDGNLVLDGNMIFR